MKGVKIRMMRKEEERKSEGKRDQWWEHLRTGGVWVFEKEKGKDQISAE